MRFLLRALGSAPWSSKDYDIPVLAQGRRQHPSSSPLVVGGIHVRASTQQQLGHHGMSKPPNRHSREFALESIDHLLESGFAAQVFQIRIGSEEWPAGVARIDALLQPCYRLFRFREFRIDTSDVMKGVVGMAEGDRILERFPNARNSGSSGYFASPRASRSPASSRSPVSSRL
jgi:hypothetical protein